MLRKFRVKINEKEYMVEMEELGGTGQVHAQPVESTFPVQTPAPAPAAAPAPAPQAAAPAPAPATGEGEPVIAPMPGNILDIRVKVGDTVAENQVVAVLEAMKMENEIVAPKAGTITAINATKGSAIDVGQPIVFIG